MAVMSANKTSTRSTWCQGIGGNASQLVLHDENNVPGGSFVVAKGEAGVR
jgi:hypothetical protein